MAGGPSVWALRECGELLRIESATGEVVLRQRIGRGARQMVVGQSALWASVKRGGEMVRIGLGGGEVEMRVKPLHQVVALAAGDGVLWTGSRKRTSSRKGWLSRIDATSLAVEESYELPAQPRAITWGGGAVWIACARRGQREGTLERFDPASGSLEAREATNWPVYDLAFSQGSVLATMGVSVPGPFDSSGMLFDIGSVGGGGDGGGGGGG